MIKELIKYSVAFFCVAIALMVVLAFISSYLVDQKAFSQTLSDLGSFGSFLSGIAAIIAAGAAALGVTSWLKQLKFGKHLYCIWDVQTALRKINAEEMIWYFHKYGKRNKESEFVSKLEKELEDSFNNLKKVCYSLDSVVVKKGFKWTMQINTLHHSWTQIKIYLETSDKPEGHQNILNENSTLVPLNSNFRNYMERCSKEIEKLENKYS